MVYYLCPDYDIPSWGVGMLYYHVSFLVKNNIPASILHEKPGFKLSWLNLDLPIAYRSKNFAPTAADILIVPDVYIEDEFVVGSRCRKILFVQNAFIVFERVQQISRLNRAGFEAVFYYMPHLHKVLVDFFDIPLYETPAFIADYYFVNEAELHQREKLILIYPKLSSRDYPILQKLLKDKYYFEPNGFIQKLIASRGEKEWKVKEITDMSHLDVASLMKKATFFINLNTHEAFNSSVPEAMAAGCINFTYEAFGPADFLKHNSNAFVYQNNYIFDLFRDLLNQTATFREPGTVARLQNIRNMAQETAMAYTSGKASQQITSVYRQLLQEG